MFSPILHICEMYLVSKPESIYMAANAFGGSLTGMQKGSNCDLGTCHIIIKR